MTRRGWAGMLVAGVLAGCGGGADEKARPAGPGPWPTDEVKDYSQAYAVGTPQGIAFDDAYNLWLLNEDQIGVLRPGDRSPHWTRGVGQAGKGFASTVICGGAPGRAYVGYMTYDLEDPGHATEAEKAEGDADLVALGADGQVTLEKHLTITNSNDPRWDETRSILTCVKVMRGPFAGEVYFGTNHAVTRVRGEDYSDHRHPVFKYPEPNGSLHIGYHWAVSITQDGDVFLGNEWKIGMLTPTPELKDFADATKTPWKLDTYVEALGAQQDMDTWRATAQTTDRRYYLGSKDYGLWELELSPRKYTRIEGLPSKRITALAATDDGSLFIGTGGGGLWRMKPDKSLEKVATVKGEQVRQLVYDPTVEKPMLGVLTDAGLFVLRGH